MVEDRDSLCYETLLKVFRDHAYASLALNAAMERCRSEDKPYVTNLFYGVLERSVYYDYVLHAFAKQKPKKPIETIVKMGYYLLENTALPSYAAVDNMVKLCKKTGKGGASGFVNSALRKFSAVPLPAMGSTQYLSVRYSYPLWLCERLLADYGYAFTEELLAYKADKRTHIRVNEKVITKRGFTEKYASLFAENKEIEPSEVGYYVSGAVLKKIQAKDYVVQSASSIEAVYAYLSGLTNVNTVLDLCAAPGGKAVLTATLTGAQVTACDIHPHRVQLIKQYAAHCSEDLTVTRNDATVLRPEWSEKFDLVICDVPCSGMGTVGSKPDILFNRKEEDIDALVPLQRRILQTASAYVKPNGRLCYSTCSIIQKENSGVVESFLSANKRFVREKIQTPFQAESADFMELFPHIHHTDGFFAVAMKKLG